MRAHVYNGHGNRIWWLAVSFDNIPTACAFFHHFTYAIDSVLSLVYIAPTELPPVFHDSSLFSCDFFGVYCTKSYKQSKQATAEMVLTAKSTIPIGNQKRQISRLSCRWCANTEQSKKCTYLAIYYTSWSILLF